jgi:hypothetical protein
MDFPGSGLIGAIIAHNMKFASNVSAIASDFPKVMKDISYSATAKAMMKPWITPGRSNIS